MHAGTHVSRLRGPLLAVLSPRRQLKGLASAGKLRTQQVWLTWDHSHRRHALTAASFVAVGAAIAVPLGMVAAHPRPERQGSLIAGSATAALAPLSMTTLPIVPVEPLAAAPKIAEVVQASGTASDAVYTAAPKSTEAVHASDALHTAAPATIAGAALVSDVSTMDLMMPIAEPDLDIASHQSLWAQVGKEFGVDPLLLYSIALVESKSLHPGGDIGPTPWLFRVNDHLVVGEQHHVQMEMAVASQLNAAVQDVGIMQVYYPMHRGAVRDPLSLLDPKTNISVAAKILHEGMHETSDPVLGVGYYHSHTPQLARDYGTAVMTVYQRLKGVYRSGKNARAVAR